MEDIFIIGETEKEAVNTIVLSCFEETVKEAFFVSSFQGGYLDFTDRKDIFSERKQHYYYYYENTAPNITFIYQLLESYIINNTITCIEEDSLATIYDISLDSEQTSVSFLSEEETTAVLLLPITIKTDTKTEKLTSFTTTLPIAFEKMYTVALLIVESIEERDPLICLSCIHEIAEQNNIFITINEFEEHGDYYILYDTHSVLYDAPLAFAFAVQTAEDFDPTTLLEERETYTIKHPTYNATVGEEFVLNVNTKDFLEHIIPHFVDNPTYYLTFADLTPLFDIDPDLGTITFIPTEKQRGTHTAIIKIQDSNEDTTFTSIDLVIT